LGGNETFCPIQGEKSLDFFLPKMCIEIKVLENNRHGVNYAVNRQIDATLM